MDRTSVLGTLAAALVGAAVFVCHPMHAAPRELSPARHVALVEVPSPGRLPGAAERDACARLIERLTALEARLIVLAAVWAPGDEPDATARLAAAVQRSGRVLVAEGLDFDPVMQRPERRRCDDALRRAARAVGVLAVAPDPDGVVRRAALSAADGGPSLALEARDVLAPSAPLAMSSRVPGTALMLGYPSVPALPLPVLTGPDELVAPLVRGRAVVIGLARPAERYPLSVERGSRAPVRRSPAWLTAAWIECLCEDAFTVDVSERVGPAILLLLVPLGFAFGRVSAGAGTGAVVAMSLVAIVLGRLALPRALFDGVGLACAVGFQWLCALAIRARRQGAPC